jgi:hypothetical protein
MVVDSPYRSTELVLAPWVGVLLGALGVLPILVAFRGLALVGGVSDVALLEGVGALLIRAPGSVPVAVRVAGFTLLAAIGGVGGLLYAASQARAPLRGLVVVGLFYGFLLWMVSRVLLGGLLPASIRHLVHSGSWAAACVSYGLWLAAAAALSQRLRPWKAPVVKD